MGIQVRRALDNVEIAAQTAGGTWDDIVSLRLYIVGEPIHQSSPVREGLQAFFHPDRLPTGTWIGVIALASPDFLIEIEAIAMIE